MLEHVAINLFKSPAQTLVNTVNTVGVMGKGIAAEFRLRYPDMFRLYKKFCQSGDLTVGKLYLYRGENKWVLNFPTKEHWRRPSKLEYIEAGLQKFVDTYATYGITSISFPRLGTGNGGLSWDVVRPVMERYLEKVTIPVYIHGAAAPDGFVPEHMDKRQIRAFRSPRIRISFMEFFRDLQEHAEAVESPPSPRDPDEIEPLPAIRFASHLLPGEDFELLWSDLLLQGAVRAADFPPCLAAHADSVTRLLLHLGYIEPMEFSGSGAGIRFAPAPDPSERQLPLIPFRENLDS